MEILDIFCIRSVYIIVNHALKRSIIHPLYLIM